MTVSGCFGLSYFLLTVFQCGYFATPWEFYYRWSSFECTSQAQVLGLGYTHASISTLTDLLFAILPIPMIKRASMARREKITVMFILVLASLGAIASALRIRYIRDMSIPTLKFFANAHEISIWSCVEPATGIIAGSLATLRPLMKRFVSAYGLGFGNSKSEGTSMEDQQTAFSWRKPTAKRHMADETCLDTGDWDEEKELSTGFTHCNATEPLPPP
jgi:hypothetical protein